MVKDWILGDVYLDIVGEIREVFWGRDIEVLKVIEWIGKWRKFKLLDLVIIVLIMIFKYFIVVGE